jgi:hypothetical protein
VTASAIVRDTTTTSAPVHDEHNESVALLYSRDGRSITIRSSAARIDGAHIVDALGRRLAVEPTPSGTGKDLHLEVDALAAGTYYVQLRIGTERISKQFIVIK